MAHRKGTLKPDCLSKLRKVPGLRGFDAVAKLRTGFYGRVAQLQALVTAGQDPNLPSRSKKHDGLGGWLSQQRCAHRKHPLKPERLAALHAVPGLRGFE